MSETKVVGILPGGESPRNPTEIIERDDGTLAIIAYNEGGFNCTGVDVADIIKWLRENRPGLLASHPPDDDTPVDESWLRECGLRDGVMGTHKLMACWDAYLGNFVYWYGMTLVPSPRTRGDVRRLAKAMGVTLKEKL